MLFGKYVNQFYKKYWYHFVLGIIFLLLVDIIQLFIPQIVGDIVRIFDVSTENELSAFFNKGLFEVGGYLFYIMCFVLIAIGMFIGRSGWRLAINRLGIKIDRDLRMMMFEHAEKMSINFYNNQKTGSLMTLFNNDIEAIKSAFTEGVIFLIDGIVLGGLAIFKLFMVNWFLALLAIMPLSLIAFSGGIVGKMESKRYDAQLNAFEKLSDYTQENFQGIAVIKAFVREIHELKEFAKYNKKNKEASLAYLRFSIILNALIDLLIYSVAIIIMFVGGYLAKGSEINEIFLVQGDFGAGELTEFFGYFDSLIWPMFAFGMLIDIWAKSHASLKKVSAFLDTEVDLKDIKEEDAHDLPKFTGDITFKNLSFNYPNSSVHALENIDIHIKAGENVGVVGRTGSGKSTLVKILLKIYNIDDGQLFFSGVGINAWPSKVIRDNIGYVAQNDFLFSDLIENNISFADQEKGIEEIRNAARFACVDDAITSFKDGYHTLIGEKGATLSGGQKQRIAMARAIIKNPALLILDDSVSAVDSDTEQKILTNINELRKGKTTIIVSSRISAVENLDHIIVLDEGKIVGYGNHKYLLEHCESYAKIVHLQELEKEKN